MRAENGKDPRLTPRGLNNFGEYCPLDGTKAANLRVAGSSQRLRFDSASPRPATKSILNTWCELVNTLYTAVQYRG